jgi:hypothetical protein
MRSREQIVEDLKMAAHMLLWDDTSPSSWICAESIALAALADIVMQKRAMREREQEVSHVEGPNT